MDQAAPATSKSPEAAAEPGRPWLRWIAMALISVAFTVGAWLLVEYLPAFKQWVASLGALGPVVFIATYVVAIVALVPALAFTLASGAIFGPVFGTLYAFIAATIGAALAFLVSRRYARRWVEERVQRDPRFATIDRAVASEGRKIVFYCVASLGMIPGTFLYVYLGSLGGDAAVAASGAGEIAYTGYALKGVGLLATLAVIVIVTRIARKALREATGE